MVLLIVVDICTQSVLMYVFWGMNAGGGRKSCTRSDMKPFRIIGRICARRA